MHLLLAIVSLPDLPIHTTALLVTGPANNALAPPSYPRLSWDRCNCPWTDGRGDQEPYATAVKVWSSYHEALSDANSNKISKTFRGYTLRAQLFDRAVYLCLLIPLEILQSEDGEDAIVKCLYEGDPLSAVLHLTDDFSSLLDTRRQGNYCSCLRILKAVSLHKWLDMMQMVRQLSYANQS